MPSCLQGGADGRQIEQLGRARMPPRAYVSSIDVVFVSRSRPDLQSGRQISERPDAIIGSRQEFLRTHASGLPQLSCCSAGPDWWRRRSSSRRRPGPHLQGAGRIRRSRRARHRQQGQFVRNLTKDDFQVFEDGKRQTISTFSLVDIPIERADRPLFATRPIEPDVKTNERPFDGRVYVMILDDLHVDAMRTQRVEERGAAVHRAQSRRQRPDGGHLHRWAVRRTRRSSPATSGCCWTSVDKFMGQKLDVADDGPQRGVLPPGRSGHP